MSFAELFLGLQGNRLSGTFCFEFEKPFLYNSYVMKFTKNTNFLPKKPAKIIEKTTLSLRLLGVKKRHLDNSANLKQM